jgi:hypothetical protein
MKKYLSLLFIAINVYGCYAPRYVYSPPAQIIPLLQKKNELEVSAFYSGSINAFKTAGNYNHGFDMQGAWAVTNHFALTLDESTNRERNGSNDTFFQNDSSVLSYKRNFTGFSAGYYTSLKNNSKMQLQVFGGAAFGSSKIFDDFSSNSSQVNKYHFSRVTKLFIQPALIYSPVKLFSASLSSRFTQVVFTNIRTNYTATELNNYILDSIGISPVFFWEPAVCYSVGFKKSPVKIRLQGSITVLLNHRFVEHHDTNVGIGMTYDFLRSKQKKPAASK